SSTANPGSSVPAKETSVAPVNPDPEMVMLAPTGPSDGEKPSIAGGCTSGTTVKSSALEAVPSGVVTEIGPVVAPAGTVEAIVPSSSTANPGSSVPAKETSVAPVNPDPEMVMLAPTGPSDGEKPSIAGGCTSGTTVKSSALAGGPPGAGPP